MEIPDVNNDGLRSAGVDFGCSLHRDRGEGPGNAAAAWLNLPIDHTAAGVSENDDVLRVIRANRKAIGANPGVA